MDVPLFQRKFLKPILLAFLIAFFNQISGINAIAFAVIDKVGRRVLIMIGAAAMVAMHSLVAWDFWTDAYLGERKGSLSAAVPPRGVRLFALQPLAGHPQFLTSDRHLTQGAVGLFDQKWDGSRLVAKVDAVGGFPQVVRFAVPNGWKVKSATANGVGSKVKEEYDGRVVAVELSVPRSSAVDLCLDF